MNNLNYTSNKAGNYSTNGIWHPPAGQFRGFLDQVKIEVGDSGKVRHVFKIPKQGRLSQDYLAAKTYSQKQYPFLIRDLITWLGKDKVESLLCDGHLPFENLKTLIGECASLEIVLIEQGQEYEFREIRSIKPCDDQAPGNSQGGQNRLPGIDFSLFKSLWN